MFRHSRPFWPILKRCLDRPIRSLPSSLPPSRHPTKLLLLQTTCRRCHTTTTTIPVTPTDTTTTTTITNELNWDRFLQIAQPTATDYVNVSRHLMHDDTLPASTVLHRLQYILRQLDEAKRQDAQYHTAFQKTCNMLMYAYLDRHHDLASAKVVFEGMLKTDGLTEVSIATMVTGITQHGSRRDLYELIDVLRRQGAMPASELVYVRLLRALRHFGDIKGCRFFFAEMLEHDIQSVAGYRCMMAVYHADRQRENVLKLFRQALELKIEPDTAMYHMALECLKPHERTETFNMLRDYWHRQSPTLVESRMSTYLLLDWDPLEALEEIQQVMTPITRDYNQALAAYVKQNDFDRALEVLTRMNGKGITMDSFSYSILLDALAKDNASDPAAVFELYDEMKRNGVKADVVVFTSLFAACHRARDLPKALDLLAEMDRVGVAPNIYTYNAVLTVMANADHRLDWTQAKELWTRMRSSEVGVEPDTRTYNIYLSVLANARSTAAAKEMVECYREMKRVVEPDFLTYTVLINGLSASHPSLRAALQVYNDAKLERVSLPVSVYNRLMVALQRGAEVSEAMNVWHDMRIRGVLPDNDKAKNARTKRFLKNREAKVNENPKTALFVRGSTTSQVVNDALKDLYALKRPNAIYFSKKNELKPFEDEEKLEFFSQKNDSAHLIVGTHSKKRPHNLTFVRMFNHQLLDMYEFGLENAKAMSTIGGAKCSLGLKPLMVFNGDRFESDEKYKQIKNFFLDFFNGEETAAINLAGLEHVVSLTAVPDTERILLRTYSIEMKKSGLKTPRVELEEMGPHYDLVLRRSTLPKADLWNAACKKMKKASAKKTKNVEVDEMGDRYGRIHLGKQDFSKIQTRKMKGLKKRGADDDDEEDTSAKKQKVDADED
ncbi:MAG: Brix domain-containing protein [Benjaminiella poitrasii]|nr:MAG: Brix domain-containing protein [Benjaminiella poitrasii]